MGGVNVQLNAQLLYGCNNYNIAYLQYVYNYKI